MKKTTLSIILFFIAGLAGTVYSQVDKFHPEFQWYTLKTKFAEVHYHDGAERTALVVAKIIDDIWEPITSLYGYSPDGCHFVIKDIDDYSNGATFFFDNKIEIWTSALDFDLRGYHNWLRNVISHEFTHLVQIQAGLKTTRSIPAFYFQYLNYEDKRRPDLLYGFPNVIVSYPIAMLNIPAWFAEGTAQYMRKEFDYDRWDSHRDMIVRSYALDGKMLTWNQMGVFGKTSLGNESVYNSGYALTKYIAQKYGEDKLRVITENLGDFGTFTFDAAVEDALGITGNTLYNDWKDYITSDYRNRIKEVVNNKVEGKVIGGSGFGNFYPVLSKDGIKTFYISNKGSDYFGPTALYEYDNGSGKEELLIPGVRSSYDFLPEGNKIIYSKLTDENPNGYNVHDIFVYDIAEKEEKRLTYNMRANQPSISPDGKQIVFLFQKDGTTNLGMVDSDGSNFRQMTFFYNGEQVYGPKFSPDGSKIVFDYAYHHGRDIYMINSDGSELTPVLISEADERGAVFSGNDTLIYSSDETGIYNIYSYSLTEKGKVRLTNVTGGAFMPSVDNYGNLAYAGYTSGGYKIFYLDKTEKTRVNQESVYIKSENWPLGSDKPKGDMAQFDLERLKNFYDYDVKKPDSVQPYTGKFTRLSFFPFVRFDNYNTSNSVVERIKPGVYVTSSDILNRFSVFAGASLNTRMERDLFFSFEYKHKLPILYNLGIKPILTLELYNISRKTNTEILIDELPATSTDVSYNLFEFDIVAKHKIFKDDEDLELRYIFSSYTATIGSFLIPETGILYPTTNDTYFYGSNLQAEYRINSLIPSRNMDINPVGFTMKLRYNFEINRYNPDGEYTVEDGILKPQYRDFNFHRLEMNTMLSIPVFEKSALALRLRGGTIFGPDVPDFFDFYLGGLIGMKSYPFYSISGNEVAWANLTYRFPLFSDIDGKLGHLYIDKVYLSLFGDIGNAWNGDFPAFDQFKKGAGAEIRIGLNSFYLFPTNVFFSAAYGFDEYTRVVRNENIRYGKEWNFYGGVLFSFDF